MSQLDSVDLSPVIERMGGAMALASSARKHRAFLRPRGIKSAVDLLRLAFMYGPGGYSLRALAAMAAADDVADVSDVAVLERLKRTADWLQSLCEEALSRVATVIGAGLVKRPIRIVDSSRIEGPGSRVWRLHLCYDAGLARIVDAAITTTKDGDRLDRFAITPGEIRIGDRGFAQPDKIKRALVEGADVLVRLSWKGLQLTRPGGEPIDWMNLFDQAAAQGSLDMPVLMRKAHSAFEPVALRLVLIKKPPAAAAKARAKTRRASQRNQNRIDPRTLASADYVILLTSLGCNEFSVSLLGALYRLRWQVELAIKRLKSILHIDRLPAKNADLARAWLYAHLLLALLLEEATAELDALSPSAVGRASDVGLAHHRPSRRSIPGQHLAATKAATHHAHSG
jgi:IS4 transposase